MLGINSIDSTNAFSFNLCIRPTYRLYLSFVSLLTHITLWLSRLFIYLEAGTLFNQIKKNNQLKSAFLFTLCKYRYIV